MADPDPTLDPALAQAYQEAAARESGPPAHLDDAIRAAARRAVAARPTPVGRTWTRRLTVPLALAATVMLAIGVTLRTFEQAELEADTHARLDIRIPSEDSLPSQARVPAPVAPPGTTAEAPGAAPAANAAPAPIATTRKRDANDRSAAIERVPEAAAIETAPSSAPARHDAPRSADAIEQSAPVPLAKSSANPGAGANVADPPAQVQREERRASAPSPAGVSGTIGAPAAAAPPPAPPIDTARSGAGGALRGDTLSREPAAAPRLADAARAEPTRQAAVAAPPSADQLIERAREHRRENRLDEARRLVRELRERYPSVTVPDDLRDLLPPR